MNANTDSMLMRLLLLLLLTCPLLSSSNSEVDSLHNWRLALVDPANVLQSWDPTLVNPCSWFHITCNTQNSVIRVEVFGNQIEGYIPKELGNLNELVSLDLHTNHLIGHIPKSLGKLRSLTFLRLNNNNLSGPIPRELTKLKKLQVLDLSSNDLCGTIPLYGGLSDFTPLSFQNNPRLNKTGSCS